MPHFRFLASNCSGKPGLLELGKTAPLACWKTVQRKNSNVWSSSIAYPLNRTGTDSNGPGKGHTHSSFRGWRVGEARLEVRAHELIPSPEDSSQRHYKFHFFDFFVLCVFSESMGLHYSHGINKGRSQIYPGYFPA